MKIDTNIELQNRCLTHPVIIGIGGRNDHLVRAHMHVLADWLLRDAFSAYARCAYYAGFEIVKRMWQKLFGGKQWGKKISS